jgi:hypothetical protein
MDPRFALEILDTAFQLGTLLGAGTVRLRGDAVHVAHQILEMSTLLLNLGKVGLPARCNALPLLLLGAQEGGFVSQARLGCLVRGHLLEGLATLELGLADLALELANLGLE